LRHDGGDGGLPALGVEARYIFRDEALEPAELGLRAAAEVGGEVAQGLGRRRGRVVEEATTVPMRVLSLAGNIRGLSERTWMSSSSTAVRARASASAAVLMGGAATRARQLSAWARTSRRRSTASCTRPRSSWASRATAEGARRSS